MKIVTSAEMREIDRITSEKFGVPSLTLMENAGSAVAEFALSAYPSAKSFGVICGKGNNGGDGFVVARKLHEAGKKVRLLLLGDPAELRGDAAANYAKLASRSKSPPFRKECEKGGVPSLEAPMSIHPVKITKGGAASDKDVFDCEVLIDAIL